MAYTLRQGHSSTVAFVLNGRGVSYATEARASLASMLRESAGATSVHLGCEHGICGACTVIVDGVSVRSCLMLAVQADGAEVETLEGASSSGRIADLQEAFVERAASQCGFCTPGMLIAAAELLDRDPSPDREAIRAGLSGNICRCTGYQAIVDAVERVAIARRARAEPEWEEKIAAPNRDDRPGAETVREAEGHRRLPVEQ